MKKITSLLALLLALTLAACTPETPAEADTTQAPTTEEITTITAEDIVIPESKKTERKPIGFC